MTPVFQAASVQKLTFVEVYYRISTVSIYVTRWTKTQLVCIANSVFEKYLIEIYWVKNTYYKNNLVCVLITSTNSETRLESRQLSDQQIRLLMASKNIFLSRQCHEANMSYGHLFTLQ